MPSPLRLYRLLRLHNARRQPASAFRSPASIFSAATEATNATDSSGLACHERDLSVLLSVVAAGTCPGSPGAGLGLAANDATELPAPTIRPLIRQFWRSCQRPANASLRLASIPGPGDRSDEATRRSLRSLTSRASAAIGQRVDRRGRERRRSRDAGIVTGTMERKPMSPRRKAGELWFVVIMLATLIAALGGAPVLFLALLGAVQVAGYVALYYIFK